MRVRILSGNPTIAQLEARLDRRGLLRLNWRLVLGGELAMARLALPNSSIPEFLRLSYALPYGGRRRAVGALVRSTHK